MADSSRPMGELQLKLTPVLSALLQPEPQTSAQSAAEQTIAIAQAYVAEHVNDPSIDRRPSAPKRDTPGAETFFWLLWECVLKGIGEWDSEQVLEHKLNQAIAFVKALQAWPQEEEPKWTIWGEDTTVRTLPLIGPSMREANNGPFVGARPDDDALGRPEVQNALAGAPPATSVKDESVELAARRRRDWLAFQGFMARLWTDAGLGQFAVCAVWAIRDGLEDWPAAPPHILEEKADQPVPEETPAYRVLMVESAAAWLQRASPELYKCTEIWGPNGNAEWPKNHGAPGRGGERWQGVDGMDKEKQRWALWREVLKDVVAWYDREEVAGRGAGWKVKEAVGKALEAMYNAQTAQK